MTNAKKPAKKVTKATAAKGASTELSEEQLERVAGGTSADDTSPKETISFDYNALQVRYKP